MVGSSGRNMPTIPNTSDTQPKMIRKIRTILISSEFRELSEIREVTRPYPYSH